MTSVVLAGESGGITEIIEIGPTSLVRRRSWAKLQPLADACKTAGTMIASLPYGPLPDGLASPTVRLLSDPPFLAAEAFGILGRLQIDVPVRSGRVMIGGAFSFTVLKAAGGWEDPQGASSLPELTAGGRRSPEWHTACSVKGRRSDGNAPRRRSGYGGRWPAVLERCQDTGSRRTAASVC